MNDGIYVSCKGIVCDSGVTMDVPPGWSGLADVESLWCPNEECELQHGWFQSVCPGCVSGYPDCPLSESFAYSKRVTITEGQLAKISSGVCPFRVNGMSLLQIRPDGTGTIESWDLSERATPEQGEAIARGIRAYIEKYGEA